jgi:DNA topoisomerase-3
MSLSILAVAEKPSVAKEIANVLSSGAQISVIAFSSIPSCSHWFIQRQGLSPYNRFFDVANVEFMQHRGKITVTSVAGHLINQEFPPECKSWTDYPTEKLFDVDIVQRVSADHEQLKQQLVQEARKHNVLFLWLDCDLGTS